MIGINKDKIAYKSNRGHETNPLTTRKIRNSTNI